MSKLGSEAAELRCLRACDMQKFHLVDAFDAGRIERHIIPPIGARRVKDLTKTDINKVLKDIMAGKTRVSVKTKKLRGKAIV